VAWALVEGRKQFFFEKKNQKTFVPLMREDAISPHQVGKVFLLLFLQKKKSLASFPATARNSCPAGPGLAAEPWGGP
jgi:hypothetical protein